MDAVVGSVIGLYWRSEYSIANREYSYKLCDSDTHTDHHSTHRNSDDHAATDIHTGAGRMSQAA